MKRMSLVFVIVMCGCVDSGCPKGSAEVDGTCMTIDGVGAVDGGQSDGGEDRAPTDGRSDGGGAAHGDAGDERDGGADAGGPASACTAFECAEHAHCVEEGDDAACVCDEGYEGDGESCQLNPCAEGANPCDAETTQCAVQEDEAVCECLDGWTRCGAEETTCSVDLRSDAANCGACDATCAGDLACVDGSCEQELTKLSLGQSHSCALKSDGAVVCWGNNDFGQLQRSDASIPRWEPAASTISNARLLSTSLRASCAVTESHALVCWGDNVLNWLSPGSSEGFFELGSGLHAIEDVVVGFASACYVSVGVAYCWGVPGSYAPGIPGDIPTFADPHRIDLDEIVQLSVGVQSCAITSDGGLSCWGNGIASPTVVGSAVGPLEDVVQVSASQGSAASCALMGDGRVMCRGMNRLGILGNSGAALEAESVQALPVVDASGNAIADFDQVAVGAEHACARRMDGRVMCWGKLGQLGGGGSGSSAQPYATEVREIDDAIEVAAGQAHTCVRRKSGQVQCWGDNAQGQLGVAPASVGGIASSPVPVNVLGLP